MESRRKSEERRASTSRLQSSTGALTRSFSVDEWWLCCEAVSQYREQSNDTSQESYANYLEKALVGMITDSQGQEKVVHDSSAASQTQRVAGLEEKQGQVSVLETVQGDLIAAGRVCEMVEKFESLQTKETDAKKIEHLPSREMERMITPQTPEQAGVDHIQDSHSNTEATPQLAEQSNEWPKKSNSFRIEPEGLESLQDRIETEAQVAEEHQGDGMPHGKDANCEQKSRCCFQDAATMTSDDKASNTSDIGIMAYLPPRIVTTSEAVSDSEIDHLERVVIRDNSARSPGSIVAWQRDVETSRAPFVPSQPNGSSLLDSAEAVDPLEVQASTPQAPNNWPGHLITCLLSIVGTLGILQLRETFHASDFTDIQNTEGSKQQTANRSGVQSGLFRKGTK